MFSVVVIIEYSKQITVFKAAQSSQKKLKKTLINDKNC